MSKWYEVEVDVHRTYFVEAEDEESALETVDDELWLEHEGYEVVSCEETIKTTVSKPFSGKKL